MSVPITVLKFGGSYLRGPADLLEAVDVIYAHLRRGERVVAVTSAFHGHTDALADQLRALDQDLAVPSANRVRAALLSLGELQTANLLCAALHRAGIPAGVADIARVGPFVLPGTEDPTGVDAVAIRRLLDQSPVLCFPGFAAVEQPCGDKQAAAEKEERVPALLGRGGSDLTAMVLGHDLDASVVLVKDVEGLYTSDPTCRDASAPLPRRLARVSFDDALELGPDILQPRAVHFARAHSLAFEVVGPENIAGTRGTRVGRLPTVERSWPAERPATRVALLGLGAVGRRVFDQLSAIPGRFEVVSILVRDAEARDRPKAAAGLLTESFEDVLAATPEIVIEATGGHQPAAERMERAMADGIHVVTANKVAAALANPPLDAVARASGVEFACSAAVGGAMPALEAVARAACGGENDPLVGFEGVLNGTSNAVLDAVASGCDRSSALARAREQGLCEADPRNDLDGTDVVHKLELLVRAAGWPAPRWLRRDGIEEILSSGLNAPDGQRLRLVGGVFLSDMGPVASVGPRAVGEDSEFYRVHGAWNALTLHFESGRRETIEGRGAGPWPTAAAVVADVLSVIRRRSVGRASLARGHGHREDAR